LYIAVKVSGCSASKRAQLPRFVPEGSPPKRARYRSSTRIELEAEEAQFLLAEE
jgi:hypothetical protein